MSEVKHYDLNCPRCEKPLNFLAQIDDMIQMSEGEIMTPWMLNFWCETCQDMTTSMYWEENDEAEEIEVPALREATGGIDRLMINRPKNDKPISGVGEL